MQHTKTSELSSHSSPGTSAAITMEYVCSRDCLKHNQESAWANADHNLKLNRNRDITKAA